MPTPQRFYDVYTDLDPQTLTQVAIEVMLKWISFALGHEQLNGHMIENPTGLMASAVHIEQYADNHVAIIMDETIAPEAGYMETGHASIDMKKYLKPGTYYPMHRGGGVFSGFAQTPPRAPSKPGVGRTGWSMMYANSWIIPAMPAWSPASYLANMIQSGEFTK